MLRDAYDMWKGATVENVLDQLKAKNSNQKRSYSKIWSQSAIIVLSIGLCVFFLLFMVLLPIKLLLIG